MVHGAWCMVHGAWCMVHGTWRRPPPGHKHAHTSSYMPHTILQQPAMLYKQLLPYLLGCHSASATPCDCSAVHLTATAAPAGQRLRVCLAAQVSTPLNWSPHCHTPGRDPPRLSCLRSCKHAPHMPDGPARPT
eukprot:245259-Chlamydomonas_euryale.AAC.1